MGRRSLLFFAVGVAAVATVAACSSSSSPGQGQVSTSHRAPTSHVASKSPTDFPSTTASSTASTSGSDSCPAKAAYCAQFDGSADGWPVTNQTDYFAQYTSYAGGTYRLGQRSAATEVQQAPVDITKISHDYSVQIDVDAIPYHSMPLSTSAGIDCWQHKSNGHTAAFLFFVDPSTVEIGMWDELNGEYHKIASKSDAGLVKTDGSPNHFTVACVQSSHNGGATAELGIKINGKVALVTRYDKSLKNYEWSVGPGVGLLASGKGADIFYDNFAVTSLCRGTYC